PRADARRVRLHAAALRARHAPAGPLPLPGAGLGAPPAHAHHRHLADLPPVRTVPLYSRPGCHLCDDARAALARVRLRTPFALQERNTEEDDALPARYLERIPVIALDGEALFDFFLEEETLEGLILYRKAR